MRARVHLPATLGQLADIADIRGSAADASDLRRAAIAIEGLGPDEHARIVRLARKDRLDEVPEIDAALHWRIREVVSEGADEVLAAARERLPFLVRRLAELGTLSLAAAVVLTRRAGVLTYPDLEIALDERRVDTALGAEPAARLRSALPALWTQIRRTTLGRAWDLLDGLLPLLAGIPGLQGVQPSGELRRFEPLVGTVSILGVADDPSAVLDAIAGIDSVAVLARTPRRAIVAVRQTEVDVRIAAPDEAGTALFYATGSRAHVRAVVQRRGRIGLYGREEQVYAQAGLAYVPPEIRHASGEIDAAASAQLPRLVSREDIRGDLHMHSTYSDGSDALVDMVAACRAIGYEYIAITDHSEGASASRTLARGDIARQRAEIARLRSAFPSLAILHGIEVDILADGTLDFPDSVLEAFDIVLASLHEAGRDDGAALTRRCLAAIRHPLVNVITHPANQLVGRRPGYALDFDAVYAAAAETGTALEVDGAPGHLDLDGEHARAAAAAGVTLVIDSDCHRARSLERQMRFGIGTARRGWIEPRHVLNARPLADVRAFIASKRAGRANA